jgi:hypothetical protein
VRLIATHTEEAERIARRPWSRRIDGRTIEATVERQCDVITWAT